MTRKGQRRSLLRCAWLFVAAAGSVLLTSAPRLFAAEPAGGLSTAPAKAAFRGQKLPRPPGEPPVGRFAIRTMPISGAMNLPAPEPAARPPVWRNVEQRLEALRRQRTNWGLDSEVLSDYYAELANPRTTQSNTFEQHIDQLAAWQEEIPDSAAARVVMAKAYIHYAWEARGGGWAATVTEEGWKLFRERIAEAHRLLDEAIKLGVKDGEAYTRLLNLAYAEGQPKDQAREWLEAGRKLDPTYYPMYGEMSTYLLPRWMGEAGDIERFAGDMAREIGGDNGLEALGRIALSVQRYEGTYSDTIYRGQYDRDLLVRAVELMMKRHPRSDVLPQFAALCAYVTQDHAAARRILPFLKPFEQEQRIWAWQNSFDDFRNWAAATEIPGGEESWIWTTQAGCTGLAFGNDRRHIWCAEQFGNQVARLINVRSKETELALPSPGGYVHDFDFDAGREWAVCTVRGERLTGWLLYDVSDGVAMPIVHETSRNCGAIAIRPKAPEVFWTEETTIRSWNLKDDKEGVEIKFPQHVHWLQCSVDGKLLGVNEEAIYDAATGELKYKLLPPPADRKTARKEFMRQLLLIDEEGRAWATIAQIGPHGEKLSLVRFSADGQTWEPLVQSLGHMRAWLSPDRKLLATVPQISQGGGAAPIDLWSVTTGKHLKQLGGHWNWIEKLAFSPDSTRLASVAMRADVIKIWSLDGITP